MFKKWQVRNYFKRGGIDSLTKEISEDMPYHCSFLKLKATGET
jgi:hypothetical protein